MAFLGEEVEGLARRAADGDRAALDALLAAIRPTVLRLAARFLPYADDAEDACQSTLLAVALGVNRWGRRSTFSTWLYQVTANQSRSTYRSLRRRATEHLGDRFVDVPDPRTTSVVAGTRLDLLDGLDALGPDLANPVALRDVLDLEYDAIAALLDLPLGTVKSRIHDGRRRLRAQLALPADETRELSAAPRRRT